MHLNEKYGSGDPHEQTSPRLLSTIYSRRTVLKHALALGVAGLVVPGLLGACSSENAAEKMSGETASEASEKCEGQADLSAQDGATRKSLNYVDKSPHLEKVCANCQFFKQPAVGAPCGSCEIVGGPIAPEGYCNSWVAQG